MFFRKNKIIDLQFPESCDIDNVNYKIEVGFFKKKSSSVSIRDNIISFRMSSHLSSKDAQNHFSSLLKRIYIQVKKKGVNNRVSNHLTVLQVIEKQEFYFAKTNYKLIFTNRRGVQFMDDTFYINNKTRTELIEKHIINKLIEIYTPRLKQYIREVNNRTYNYEYREIDVKNLKSKWGHCTSTNNLMFNLKLLNGPIDVLDYVIIHELAHIRVKNHSSTFWKEVERFCINHKDMKKKLRISPPGIFQ